MFCNLDKMKKGNFFMSVSMKVLVDVYRVQSGQRIEEGIFLIFRCLLSVLTVSRLKLVSEWRKLEEPMFWWKMFAEIQ